MLLEKGTGLDTLEGEALAEYVRACFDYNKETGCFKWRMDRPSSHFASKGSEITWNKRFAGTEFKEPKHNGYCRLGINLKAYLVHRLAFLIVEGRWPTESLDHINGEKADNRWCNLREISQALNCRNARKYKNNTSGVTGVTSKKRKDGITVWFSHYRKFHPNGKSTNAVLSRHDTFEDAVKARKEWEISEGNFTERHGK